MDELHRARRSRATWPRSSSAPTTSSGARSAIARTRATSALALPHILMRLPYGPDTVPVEAFNFEEDVDGTRPHASTCGATPPTPSAPRITDAFAKYGWCAAIRGVEGGGLVEGLPTHTFKTDEGDIALKCPTEIAITDRREKELADLGFIPLVPLQGHRLRRVLRRPVAPEAEGVRHRRGQRQRAPLGAAAVHPRRLALRPLPQGDDARQDRQLHDAGRRARRSSTAGSRNYVLRPTTPAQPDVKARYPLREARVDVTESRQARLLRAVAFLGRTSSSTS